MHYATQESAESSSSFLSSRPVVLVKDVSDILRFPMGYSLVLIRGLLWTVMVLMLHFHKSKACIAKEKFALLQIKKQFSLFSSTPNHKPYLLPSWSSDNVENCCLWERVRCDPSSGHITKLSLGSLLDPNYECGIGVRIESRLLNLTVFRDLEELQYLDLSLNCFTHLVEDEAMCELRSLQVLNLTSNEMQGEIPKCVGNLNFLTELDLSFNEFGGDFPSGICNLKRLQVLDMSGNALYGNIPTCMCELNNLQVLNLESNAIQGEIPNCVGNLNFLTKLDLSLNEFGGDLPLGLCNLNRLQVLDIGGNDLNGSFPTCLCKLLKLQILLLWGNNLNGNLPNCIGKLANVKVFALSENTFTGSIPSTISNLTNLVELHMLDNFFEGKFPLSLLSRMANLTFLSLGDIQLKIEINDSVWMSSFQLEYLVLRNCRLKKESKALRMFLSYQRHILKLELRNNDLVGSFPISLVQSNSQPEDLSLKNSSSARSVQFSSHQYFSFASQLEDLDLSENKFSGKLPENVGFLLSNLKELDLSNNTFEGQIPTTIGEMKRLKYLELSHNQFDGEVPKQLFNGLNNLRGVFLSNNNLYGEVFPKSMNLPQLASLYLDNNRFKGRFEDSLLKSSNLENLDISNNEISGQIPSWISKFNQLALLSIANNTLHGPIPCSLCNISSLFYLDLSNNRLSGRVPACNSTQYLYLKNNNLSGHIPHGLSTSSNLVALDLGGNQLVGDIPLWIGQLSNLVSLQLGKNKLQGRLPSQLCDLQQLNVLDVASNQVSGTILPCLKDLSFGSIQVQTEFYDPKEKHLDFLTKGRYYSYVDIHRFQMSGLDLSCNQLSGQIPLELGYLKATHSLNLSHNKINGFIPETFSSLRNIESLDLSFNNLSGPIPSELVKLTSLEDFNVSYNNLSGIVPPTEQFSSFGVSSYLGNPFLFWYDQGRSSIHGEALNTTFGEDEHDVKFDWGLFFWSFAPPYFIFLVASILVLYIIPQWPDGSLWVKTLIVAFIYHIRRLFSSTRSSL